MKPVATLILLAALLALATIPAHAAMSTASLQGSYILGELDTILAQDSNGPVHSMNGSNTIRFNFDGAGSCTYTSSWKEYEESGSQVLHVSDPGSGTCTYAVAPDGTITLSIGGNEVLQGLRVSTDGRTMVKAEVFEGKPDDGNGTFYTSSMFVGFKLGSAMTVASLQGQFVVGDVSVRLYKHDGLVSNMIGGNTIGLSFDGAGSCTYSSTWEEFIEGYNQVYYSDDPESGSCTYTVAPDGKLTLYIGGEAAVTGTYVSGDGTKLMEAETGEEVPSDNSGTFYNSSLMVGVKVGSGMNAASLQGSYSVGQLVSTLYRQNSGPVRNVAGGNNIQLTFDGEGACTYSSNWKEYVEGNNQVTSSTDPEAGTCSYAVASNGVTTLTLDSGPVVTFQLSADGKNLLKADVSEELPDDNSGTFYSAGLLFGVHVETVPAACGSAGNGSFTSAPGSNLCSAGVPSAVSGTGPWTWTCSSGGSGGSPASCSAAVKTIVNDGDSNGDGATNVFDALMALQYTLGIIAQTPENDSKYLAACDVYPLDTNLKPKGDGKLDIMDALAILQRAVNLLSW